MAELRLLIADNDQYVLDSYRMLFEGESIELVTAEMGSQAVDLVANSSKPYDLAIIDYHLPGGVMGDEVTQKIRALAPTLPIIVVSGLIGTHSNSKEVEKRCEGAGATKLIPKGQGISEILSFVNELRSLKSKPRYSEVQRIKKIKDILSIEGSSQALFEIALDVERFSPLHHSILIRGETGVGKECIAKAIHQNSGRKNQNFVAINCASIPKDLAESEFFGHEKGSFTGAIQKKAGKFLHAHGGTIFLDEIGDMEFPLQAKLLRVLQERVIEPVGSMRPIPVDLRIISATHQDLEKSIYQSRFREDLFYRLRELVITIPPLRERLEDIEAIALTHIAQLNARYGTSKILGERSLKRLRAHLWPGNVRELQSVLNSAHVISERVIQLKDLENALEESSLQRIEATRRLGKILPYDELTRRQLLEEKLNLVNALKLADNNKELASRLLGFKHSSQMKYRMKVTGLNSDSKWGDPSRKKANKETVLIEGSY